MEVNSINTLMSSLSTLTSAPHPPPIKKIKKDKSKKTKKNKKVREQKNKKTKKRAVSYDDDDDNNVQPQKKKKKMYVKTLNENKNDKILELCLPMNILPSSPTLPSPQPPQPPQGECGKNKTVEYENTIGTVFDPKFEKIEQKSKQQLLSYTYFLNDECTKYITLGYSMDTLKPTVILHQIMPCNSFVILMAQEWYSILVHQERITNTFFVNTAETSSLSIYPFGDQKYLRLDHIMKNVSIGTFGESDVQISIKQKEWRTMVQLTDLLNSILQYYIRTTEEVTQYFLKYTQTCFDKNLMFLGQEHFFKPTVDSKCNFIRLFNELGIFLSQKIITN